MLGWILGNHTLKRLLWPEDEVGKQEMPAGRQVLERDCLSLYQKLNLVHTPGAQYILNK